jgi:alpha-1,2-mannosyltransferase
MYARGIAAVDFRHDFWQAGLRVLHGTDPYSWSRGQVAAGISFPYPALTAVLFAPFALAPSGVSGVMFTIILLLALTETLRTLGVRDRRLYGLVLLWPPVVSAWQTANVTLLIALGLALLWRHRDRPAVAGLLVALLVSVKPIALPAGLWLLATRRYRAFAHAAVLGLAINGIAWGIVGFGELGHWLHLLSVQANVLYAKGYAVIALASHLGLSRALGTASEIAVVVAVGVACMAAGRRRRDELALALAVTLIVIGSPQVDLHYLALLIVPLAIAFPRTDRAWTYALVLWVVPAADASAWQQVLTWLVTAGVLLAVARRPEPRSAWRRGGHARALLPDGGRALTAVVGES